MMRRPPMGAKGQRPTLKGSGATMKRLLRYITGPYKLQLAIVFVCILMSAVTTVVGARFLKTLVDEYIMPLTQAETPVFSGLLGVIIGMAGIYMAGILCSLLYNRMMVTIAQGVLKRVRDSMFEHMQRLPIRYFDTHTHGDVMSRYTNDTDTLRQFISQSLPQLVNSVITATSVLVFMCINNIVLTALTILTVLLMVVVTGRVAGMSGKYFVEQQKSLGAVNGYIEEMINGQKVVKVFCHEEKAREQFNRLNDELCQNVTRANQYGNIMGPIMNNLGHLQYVLIAIAGGAMAINGFMGMTLGMIIEFLQLSRSFTNPVAQMSQQVAMVAMALAGAQRIFQLMDEPVEIDDGYVTLVNAEETPNGLMESQSRTGLWAWRHKHEDGTVTLTRLQGDVRLQEVDFEYTEGKPVLHDITLYAEPGQKVAFVGATGAGKTTITNLINRFYDIADGKIRYDGININKIHKSDLRRSLGIVLQDVNLFTDTVMENIRYGKLDASDQDVIDAAKRAGAHDFIMMLPSGYDTVLTGDGAGLSQGQRQLLSIARAAVADPPVMILDEATSSIDTRTEAIVQRGMDALMQGRTVFVIAHRLSTVQNADVIMVLEQGRIIERGSHERLIAEKGKYYQLYTGAFELE